ncbi:hypothetical protein DFH09DRAFT_1139151 [Mycena vulgaris]|nr:hypothetical protein DFH09DRAFT_1139151 [Mycena vulgaris]
MDNPNKGSPGANATAASSTAPKDAPTGPQTLTVTYRSGDKDSAEHYAVIPFHQQYEDALSAAFKILGKHMAASHADKAILKKKLDGRGVWAEFDPAHWFLVVRPGDEVGLFEKLPEKPPKDIFWRGPVYLVFGEKKKGLTTWTEFKTKNASYNPSIDRPASYDEAVEMTKICAIDSGMWYDAVKRVSEPGKTLTFYLFTDISLRNWIPLPLSVMTDEAIWQGLVPEPLGIMGVIAD